MRPKGFKEAERRKKEKLAKTACFRPYNTVRFCPPTPGSKLALKLRDILKDEEKRTGVKVELYIEETVLPVRMSDQEVTLTLRGRERRS